MNNLGEIRKVLDDFQNVKFLPARRDVSSIIKTSEDFKIFLIESFKAWDETTKSLSKRAAILRSSDIAPDQVSLKVVAIANDLQPLINNFRLLKQSIGPVTFEKVREPQFLILFYPLNHSCISLDFATGEFPTLKTCIQSKFLTTFPNFAVEVSVSTLATSSADNPCVLPKEIQALSEFDIVEIFNLGWHPVMTARCIY